MNTVAAARPVVKSAIVLFSPAIARRLQNPAFGLGVLPADRPARQWASDSEWSAYRRAGTFSAAEWNAMKAEAEAASLDRYHREASAEAQEMAEAGIPDEVLERMAQDAYEMDRLCGIPSAHAEGEVEVRTIQVRGKRYVAELIASQDDEVIAAVRLTGPKGQVYDVAKTIHGITCTCPDFVWKREGLSLEPCKHGRAANAYDLLDAPEPALA